MRLSRTLLVFVYQDPDVLRDGCTCRREQAQEVVELSLLRLRRRACLAWPFGQRRRRCSRSWRQGFQTGSRCLCLVALGLAPSFGMRWRAFRARLRPLGLLALSSTSSIATTSPGRHGPPRCWLFLPRHHIPSCKLSRIWRMPGLPGLLRPPPRGATGTPLPRLATRGAKRRSLLVEASTCTLQRCACHGFLSEALGWAQEPQRLRRQGGGRVVLLQAESRRPNNRRGIQRPTYEIPQQRSGLRAYPSGVPVPRRFLGPLHKPRRVPQRKGSGARRGRKT